MITQERLKELLVYSPIEGLFFWRVDRGRLAKRGWVAGSPTSHGYIGVKIDNKLYKAHRLAFLYMVGRFPVNEVDHINGTKSDNSWANLREATKSQNLLNVGASKNNKTGVKNVYPAKNGYRVIVNVNGKQKYIGKYDDLELAELVAIEAADKYHGEFSKTRSVCI